MDEDDLSERFHKLGFKPQKEYIYNKLLPYADKLDDESTKLFSDIKTNLVKSVLAREMRPGCALWTSRLNKYMKIYGLKFSKEDHIALVKLFYELLTIPNLEPTRINKFASTLSHLLKKRYLLSQDDLQLDWRPLYELCERISEKSNTDLGMYKYFATLGRTINNLVWLARIYFPASATQEILDEFRPLLCPFKSTEIARAIEYMEMFLPICVRREESAISFDLWFEEFMQLWEICNNSSMWERHMAWLMARLSCNNIGAVNWEPYVPIMFNRFTRTLGLPVAYRKRQSGKQFKIDVSAIAVWITSTLGGKSDATFRHLEKFMQTLESYFHPANAGSWSLKIRELLRKLSYYFVQRIHNERFRKKSWDKQTPQEYKLTDDDVARFVTIMKPCIEQAMFSRLGGQDVRLAMQYLASLRPDIIVPVALERLYASMDSLTEPHRLTSSMMAVLSVARYMVQGAKYNYPEGPTHVIPLLYGLLPGIDTNDIRKCFMTFNFIVQFVKMCPLVDSSEAGQYYDDLTEEEHILCEASAGFEDFVLQFFDRLCAWVESNAMEFTRMEQLADSSNNRKSRAETMTENAVMWVINAILGQCSPQIFTAALRKVFKFATERILEVKVSGKMMAFICQGFAKTNPKETLKLFVPHLCDTIETLMEEHENILQEENLNDEILYNMMLLSEIVDGQSELLVYMDRLNGILERTLHMTSLSGSRIAAHMLQLILCSLTFIQPMEYRSCNRSFDTHVKDFLTIREWGNPGNLQNLNISWYVPDRKEIDCAQELLNKYLLPEIQKLGEYSDGSVSLSRDELSRSLRIVNSVLALQTVLPIWDEPAINLVDSKLQPWAFQLIVNCEYTISMPDGSNVRKAIADTMHKVQRKLLELDEGDTKNFQYIIHIYDVLLFNKYRGRDFENHWKNFHLLKKTLEDRVHRNKLHLRHVLIDRVMLHQEFRNESRSCSFTATHRQILHDLFELSVSRYSDVRVHSQEKLFAAISYFPYSYTVIAPKLKEILMMNSVENHERFKGCLYVLLGPKSTPIIARHDWGFIRDMWPALVTSMPSEKPSIVYLIGALTDTVQRNFPTIAIKLEVPESCIEAAIRLADGQLSLEGFEEVARRSGEELEKMSEEKEAAYLDTVDKIVDAMETKNLHWLYHTMAMNFVKNLVHLDVKFSARAVRYFLQMLISESLSNRKIALKVALFMLMQNKPEFKKIVIDPYSFSNTKPSGVRPVPGYRIDNEWLLYNSKNSPRDGAAWDQPRYVHNQYSGFYAWPKEMKVYAPPHEQITPSKRMDRLTEQESEIFEFFNSRENLEKLIDYLALEEKKGKDQFNVYRYLLFKNLFKTFEDALLPNFLPHLKKFVEDKQEQSQRCVAEIVCGIMKGAKHWSYEKTADLWNEVLPIVRTAILNLSEETLTDWGIGLSLSARDPNRYHWLLEFLMDKPLEESTSFIASGRLFLLQMALNQQPWRNAELNQRLLEYLKNHMTHPFQNIRNQISTSLMFIFCTDVQFPEDSLPRCPRIGDFFAEVMPKLDDLYRESLKKMSNASLNNGTTTNNHRSSTATDAVVLDSEGKERESIQLFKIVAKYMTLSMAKVNFSVSPDFFRLLPLACVLQSNDADEEIEQICHNYLAVLAHSMVLASTVPAVMEAVKTVAECPFWSARVVIAEFVPVLVFHNMATFVTREEWVEEVLGVVLRLMEDVQPEVRVMASRFLGGLLHCKFVLKPQELLVHFKQKAKTKMKRRDLSSTASNSATNNNAAMCARHAGVLGLCAFIDAHPYDVPEYLPDVFAELGPHLCDPQPIPSTIRKTLEDFKRTHQDNWEVHKLKFTEEGLSILSDLTVPRSYYV